MDKIYWVSTKSSGSKALDDLKGFLQKLLTPDQMSEFGKLLDAVVSGESSAEKRVDEERGFILHNRDIHGMPIKRKSA